jgi:tRNA modification GTPase
LFPVRRRASGTVAVHVSAKTGCRARCIARRVARSAGWSARGRVGVSRARTPSAGARAGAPRDLAAAAAQDAQWEFFAEELRLAQEALGAITGQVSADALLGEIFSRFCIGK